MESILPLWTRHISALFVYRTQMRVFEYSGAWNMPRADTEHGNLKEELRQTKWKTLGDLTHSIIRQWGELTSKPRKTLLDHLATMRVLAQRPT